MRVVRMGNSARVGRGLFRAISGAASTFVLGALIAASAVAEDLKVGQPTDGAMGWQPGVTALKDKTIWFYNDLLFPIITAISLFVLLLLLWIILRYNKKANPVAAKFSHNTLIEILWTVIPVCI